MQVLISEEELATLKRVAKARGLTLAAWVREVLRRASEEEPLREREKKMDAVRIAYNCGFPTSDIKQMVAEIEQGYPQELPE